MSVILSIDHVTKRFGGVAAIQDISIELHAGCVHALVGENGAGKSTLINILSGVIQPDGGQLFLDGKQVQFNSSVDARTRGIMAVHQEADILGDLSIAENMAFQIGLPTQWGFVRWSEVYSRARRAIDSLPEPIELKRPARDLAVAQRHLIQVAAAVAEQARIVILDEPTSVLTARETDWLFEQIEQMRRQGVGIIYISHRQEEIFKLADEITVLRDGKRIWTGLTRDTNPEKLVSDMVGRSVTFEPIDRSTRKDSHPILRVENLTDAAGVFRDVSFTMNAGEIFGLYGLVGSGRSELAQAIFGMRRLVSGSIEWNGRSTTVRSPSDAVRSGIAYLPEDRLHQAICRELSVRENTILATLSQWCWGPFTQKSRERSATLGVRDRFGVKVSDIEGAIVQLSGGNQQKVVLGRWVLIEPKLLILDEPTRGVDVAAKAEIHRIIRDLAAQGTAVFMISSELPEVLAHSDRVGIFREGHLIAQLPAEEASAEFVATQALPKGEQKIDDQRVRGSKDERSTSPRPIARRFARPENLGLALALGIFAFALSISTNGRFQSSANLSNLLNNISSRAILSLAAASVIIAGGIDISIGSLLALAAASGGLAMKLAGGGPDAIVLGIAVGMGIGWLGGTVNALASVLGRIHPIVVTLGTMTVYRGLLTILTGGTILSGLPNEFGDWATQSHIGLSGSTWLLVVVAIAAYLWLEHTRPGRSIFAVGTRPSAARLMGVSRAWTWIQVYGAAGAMVGLAGMLELAQNRTMQPTMGVGYELRAIAAAVIGGVTIQGGRGTVLGVLLGATLLAVIENALVLWQVKGSNFELAIGGLLLSAILVDRATQRGKS